MTAKSLAVGQYVATAAGRFTVVYSRLEFGYRIEVHYGVSSQCVATLTRSYASGALASAIHDVIVNALGATGDVEMARWAVAHHIDGRLGALLDAPSPASAALAAELQALKAGFVLTDDLTLAGVA